MEKKPPEHKYPVIFLKNWNNKIAGTVRSAECFDCFLKSWEYSASLNKKNVFSFQKKKQKICKNGIKQSYAFFIWQIVKSPNSMPQFNLEQFLRRIRFPFMQKNIACELSQFHNL